MVNSINEEEMQASGILKYGQRIKKIIDSMGMVNQVPYRKRIKYKLK